MAGAIVTCPNCGKKNRVAPVAEGVPRCAICHNHLPWMVDVDRGTFEAALEASVPVVVDFWAPWCGPCKMIEPALEELAREHAGELKIVRLNIDTAPDIAAKNNVQGIPALLVMRDGREVDRMAGAAPKRQLEAWLERHIGAPTPGGA